MLFTFKTCACFDVSYITLLCNAILTHVLMLYATIFTIFTYILIKMTMIFIQDKNIIIMHLYFG